jgi:hypothetical protein
MNETGLNLINNFVNRDEEGLKPNQIKTWWNIPQNVGPNSNYIVP